MNTGTQAAKEAGNMVDLDSNPTKLIEIVEIGKQLLDYSRRSDHVFGRERHSQVLRHYSAMFAAFPQLEVLNIMRLRTPESAILSAVIFNALIIIALIPLALRGVRYRPVGAAVLLRRNLLLYGLGGVIAPFIGIKLIDVLLTYLRFCLRGLDEKESPHCRVVHPGDNRHVRPDLPARNHGAGTAILSRSCEWTNSSRRRKSS